MWGGVTSLDKSVFFRTQQGFGYGYGKGFRDQNTTNLDKGILKANEDFETTEQRNVTGVISIQSDDLLIPGSAIFHKLHFQKAERKFEADSCGENAATYLGTKIRKIEQCGVWRHNS